MDCRVIQRASVKCKFKKKTVEVSGEHSGGLQCISRRFYAFKGGSRVFEPKISRIEEKRDIGMMILIS